MKLLAPLLLLPLVVLADVGFREGLTYIGPVRDINCAADGGLYCTRDAGVAIGNLQCLSATTTEPGCVTPSAQSWSGTKTFNGDTRLVGHAHASLTACSSGVKGLWQTCTTHNAPVFCNGTSNVELLGATSFQLLPAIYVNGLLHSNLSILGAWALPYSYTITNVSGFVGAGAGTTQNLRFSDGTNFCDCSIDCTAGGTNFTCSGNCTYAASALVVSAITSDGCTTPTTVKGVLTPAGYR